MKFLMHLVLIVTVLFGMFGCLAAIPPVPAPTYPGDVPFQRAI